METNGQHVNKLYMENKDEIEKIISLITAKYHISGLEKEDLQQEVRIKVLEALKNWNKNKGILGVYVWSVVRNTLGEMSIYWKRFKRDPRKLNFSGISPSGISPSFEEESIDEERLQILRKVSNQVRADLLTREQKIMDTWMEDGKIYKNIVSKQLNISTFKINNSLRKIGKHFSKVAKRYQVDINYLLGDCNGSKR